MKGFSNKTVFISGKYAEEIKDKLERYHTKKFNKNEQRMIKRSKKVLSEYEAAWKD